VIDGQVHVCRLHSVAVYSREVRTVRSLASHLVEDVSSRGSEKRRADKDPEKMEQQDDRRYDKNVSKQRRETSTSTQRSESWHAVRETTVSGGSSSSAGASGAPARSAGAWTDRKDVEQSKYKTESKRPWTAQAYRESTSGRSEQDCPPRRWDRYPSDDCEPKSTQEDKKASPPWKERTRCSSWAQAV
jgi:hypothetical protein